MIMPVQRITGLAGVTGSDFQRELNQLFFVEFEGNLSRLSLFSPALEISSGSTQLHGTYTFDLDHGLHGTAGPEADIWWNQKTVITRNMVPQNNARIINLGVVDFEAITAAALQNLSYSSEPVYASQGPDNQLIPGDVFAVQTKQGNYAKVKVLAYGYDLKIEWVTYRLEPHYSVLGTGYHHPQDIKLSSDHTHAYITERTGNLLRVALHHPHRKAASVVTSGLNAPHQIFLDEAHHAAYIVEYGSAGRLVQVDLLHGTQTEMLSNLDHPVGLVMSADLQFAYITEQTTGPDHGRLSRFQLNTGWRHTLVKGLTAPFFLTWADKAQTAIFVVEREPANCITRVDVITEASHTVVSNVATHPSSVQWVRPGHILICSDSVVEDVDFLTGYMQPDSPLLAGIGLIKAEQIKPSGLAEIPLDATYFHPDSDIPFGGYLPLMVNHARALKKGATHYCVKVNGVPQLFSWMDEKWNGARYELQGTGPVSVAGHHGYYPVHALSDIGIWRNPFLAGLMPTLHLSPGLQTLVIECVNYAGNQVESSVPLTLMVDNQPCSAALLAPTVNREKAHSVSGVLAYTDRNKDEITLPFRVGHPKGYANVVFQLVKGTHAVVLPEPLPASGVISISKIHAPMVDRVSHLLGGCAVAGYVEHLRVASTVHNGWERQCHLDASDRLAFVLAP